MTLENPIPAEKASAPAQGIVRTEWPQTRTVVRMLLVVLAVATALWALHALRGVVLLLVLAVFFAYVVSPLVKVVNRPFTLRGRERRMPRAGAIGIVYLGIFGSIAIALVVFLPRLGEQVTEFAKQAPVYLVTARGRAQRLNNLYQGYQLPPTVRDAINDAVTRGVAASEAYLTAEMTNVIGWITYLPWLVLIPVFGFFLLNDAEGFRRWALQILPEGRLRWRGDEFLEDVNRTLAAYIRAQLMACSIIGIACAIGFYVIGVPYPLVLGGLAGLLEVVPLVGPLLLGVLAVTVASFHSLNQSVWALIFLVVLRIVEDYVIYPRLIGHGIHLHPFAIILAVLCGAELAGIAGIFLAIPVIAILSVAYQHWLEHRGSDGLVAALLIPRDEAAPTLSENGQPAPAG